MSEKDREKTSKRVAIGMAFGTVVLRNRRLRRNALFGLTLLTLILVFGGTVFLGDGLMQKPFAFLAFWGICFLLVGFVLLLALYDLLAIRKEHRKRVSELEKQLSDAAEEAGEIARSQKTQD